MNSPVFDYFLVVVSIFLIGILLTRKKKPKKDYKEKETEKITTISQEKEEETEKVSKRTRSHFGNLLIAFLVIMGCISILMGLEYLSEVLKYFPYLSGMDQLDIEIRVLTSISLGLTQIIVAWLLNKYLSI